MNIQKINYKELINVTKFNLGEVTREKFLFFIARVFSYHNNIGFSQQIQQR